jgi:signal peptidase I
MTTRELLKDIAFIVLVFAVIFGGLYAFAGVWPPMVSVTSDSMVPHLEKGDLVFIQGLDRANITTYVGAQGTNYSSLGEPGDVIIYRPFGNGTPVIHRVIRYVDAGEQMWPGGPPAPYAGYITQGDANSIPDQEAINICPGSPVKTAWIIGIARYRVPYVGYIRMML